MKNETTKLSITLSPETIKNLEEGDFNKSKLIIRLLKEYIEKKQK